MYVCEHCGTELYLMDGLGEVVYKCRKCRREYDEEYLTEDESYLNDGE